MADPTLGRQVAALDSVEGAGMKIQPGSVVKATSAVVDFGCLRVVPGDYGIVCDTDFGPHWFLVHWHHPKSTYTCNVGDDDVEALDERRVGRISDRKVDEPYTCGLCK